MRQSSESKTLLGDNKKGSAGNTAPSYQSASTSAPPLPPRIDTATRSDRIALLDKYRRQSTSIYAKGPAYMSTSAFQTMAEEIERQKEHTRLSRSASVGGDMVPSALNPVLTGMRNHFIKRMKQLILMA